MSLSKSDLEPDFLGDEKVQLVSSLGLLDHFLYVHFFSQLVLIDRQTFCPFSVRVQCGCLVNEVDIKDYNQRGILLTICVSTDERTSQARGVKRIYFASS